MELFFLTYKNWRPACLILAGLFLNSLFVYHHYRVAKEEPAKNITYAWHAQAYSFYKYGFSNKLASVVVQKGSIKDLGIVDTIGVKEDPQFVVPCIYDPVFYAAFCSWVWKLCGAPSFLFLMLINTFIFSIALVMLFNALKLLFRNGNKAFFTTCGALAFLPLVYHNTMNTRDVHHFYAFTIFLYFTLSYIFEKKSFAFLSFGAFLFALCHLVRPALFSSLFALAGVFFLWGCYAPLYRRKILISLSTFCGMSILFFWAPFMVFNKITYDRYFINPKGESFLVGFQGLPFPDGEPMEGMVGAFIARKEGKIIPMGDQYFDDLCWKYFKIYFKKYPIHYFKCMFLRVKGMFWHDLIWRKYYFFEIKQNASKFEKLGILLSNPGMLLEYISRLYVRLILFLGFIGLFLALFKREYLFVGIVIFGIVLSSVYLWIEHFQQRVLAMHQWGIALLAFYGLFCLYEMIKIRVDKRCIKRMNESVIS